MRLLPEIYFQARVKAASVPRSVEAADLAQAAALGVIARLPEWDPRSGTLRRFMERRIAGAMLDYLREIDPLSRSHRKNIKAGIEPPVVISRLGSIPIPRRSSAHAANHLYDGGGLLPRQISEKEDRGPAIQCSRREARAILQYAMAGISKRNREIVRLYYFGQVTELDLGRRFRVKGSRISQILKSAREKMKRALEERGIHSVNDFQL